MWYQNYNYLENKVVGFSRYSHNSFVDQLMVTQGKRPMIAG